MDASPAAVVDLTKYVDETAADHRPAVRGRRIPIATLAHAAATHGWTVAEIAHQFQLTEAQVAAGLLYYEEHREAIEAAEAVYQQALDDAHDQANHASLLSG